MTTMSAKEKMRREEEVKAMLADGASLTDIAKRYDITQQAAAKFLKVRGWRTAEAVRRDGNTEKDRLKAERRERRKAMKETVDRS